MATLTMSPAAASAPSYAIRWCPKRGKSSDHECTREAGSRDKAQRKVYALEVAIALKGSPNCIHCNKAISLVEGEGDVDRVVPGDCYLPGQIIMTCRACNNRMANPALRDSVRIDMARYAADVRRVSAGIPLRSPTACLALVREANAHGGLERSPYAL